MPPKASTVASTSSSSSPSSRPGTKKSLLVTLKVDGSKLAGFSSPTSPSKGASNRPANHSHSPRNSSPLAAGGITPDDVQKTSPNNGTSTPSVAGSVNGAASNVAGETKADASPAVKAGAKRARAGGPPGKPGRKKTKLDGPNGTAGPTAHAKLGPKSNQGAINAQLRALDRSGKPCKRWTKATITLKSFTGVQWSLPKWATPKTVEIADSLVDKAAVAEDDQKKSLPPNGTETTDVPAISINITPPLQEVQTSV